MVIGTDVIGQLVVDMFKQVFIELIWKLSWGADFVNYYLKICSSHVALARQSGSKARWKKVKIALHPWNFGQHALKAQNIVALGCHLRQ